MPTVREMFPSAYLAAEDLEGKGDESVTLTIASVQIEELRAKPTEDAKQKWTLRFEELERRKDPIDRKGFVLNKTNAKTIASLHGKEVGEWKGKRITIFRDPTVKAFGKVGALRVRPKVPPPKAKAGAA
jgi:hypothetical protein